MIGRLIIFLMNPINKRLKLLIQELDKNPNSFATGMGMSRSTVISDLINGKIVKGKLTFFNPSYEVIEKIITVYSVNPEWLLTGHGEIFKNNNKSSDNEKGEIKKLLEENKNLKALEKVKEGNIKTLMSENSTLKKLIGLLENEIKNIKNDIKIKYGIKQ